MNYKETLKELCLANGVNGVADATTAALRLLSAYTDDVMVDAMGNVLAKISAAQPDAPTVLLEAHIDEIGFVVTRIDDAGFVYVAPCGGVDNRVLAAAEIVFLAETPIYGVFCSTPPHLAKADEPIPEITERGVDVGMTKAQAQKVIPVGTRGVYRGRFDTLLGDRVACKAIDNRGGVTAVLGALDLVKGKDLPVNVAVSFCVQEELGCRGSRTAAFSLKPDVALVVDVSFAHTPDANRHQCGVLGGGVMLGYSPFLDKGMTKLLAALCEEASIPMQREVLGDGTGTDADVIGIVGEGIPCGLLSIPLRYMHTASEVVSLSDIEAVSRLMAAYILKGEVPCHA